MGIGMRGLYHRRTLSTGGISKEEGQKIKRRVIMTDEELYGEDLCGGAENCHECRHQICPYDGEDMTKYAAKQPKENGEYGTIREK